MAGLEDLEELFGTKSEKVKSKPTEVKFDSALGIALSPLPERLKAIDTLSDFLDDKFKNTGTIKRLGDQVGKPLPSIATGIYTLDMDVLQCGGIPKGRIIEIYGPPSAGKTTLTLHIIAAAQKEGGLAAFVDAEHALDPNYAKLLGVDVDNLLVTQPDSGEEALETVLGFVESGAVSIVVVDSVAALTPRAELEGDMGDSHMGLQARMMSQAMRKLTGAVAKSGVVVIFINQIRDKIGVMFGCFNYSSMVTLADGSQERIGKLVNSKQSINVLSMDSDTFTISSQPVLEFHDNGNTDKFLLVESTNGLGRSGKSKMRVTLNHMIFTPFGEKAAGDLKIGDSIVSLGKRTFSDLQMQYAIGSLLGDGSIRPTGEHNFTLRIRHSAGQEQYARYKSSIFRNMINDEGFASNGSWGFGTNASVDLGLLYQEAYGYDGKRHITDIISGCLTVRSLAIWYQDDGTFGGSYKKWGRGKCSISAKKYNKIELDKLAFRVGQLGVPVPSVIEGKGLFWYGEDSFKFQSLIAKHVHPSMNYKIHPLLRAQFISDEDSSKLFEKPRYVTVTTRITKIQEAKRSRSMRKFDLTVANNHTYFVDGMAVHNSPETTTGGKALVFYASVRLDVRRRKLEGEKDRPTGHWLEVKAAKNKVGAPFRSTEIFLDYEKGIDTYGDLVQYGVSKGVIEKSGSWLSFQGERLGQGTDKAGATLRGAPHIVEAIKKALREKK